MQINAIGGAVAATLMLIAAAVAAFADTLAVTKHGGAVTEIERAEFRAFNENWNKLAEAIKHGGFDAFAAQYDSDILWLPPNAPRGGNDAMRAQFGFFAANAKAAIHHRLDHAFLAQSGELATVVGTYEFSNASASDTGKFVLVLIKRDGAWKIAADIFNSDRK